MSQNKKENLKPEKIKYSVIINGVVFKDDKVLLAQRSNEERHVPGLWSPPGGKLEEVDASWHALEKTIKREIFEETGVEVEDKMYFLINNTFTHKEDNLLTIAIVFLCKYKAGKAQPLEDTLAVKWVSENKINDFEFTHPKVRNYVVEAFKFLKNHQV